MCSSVSTSQLPKVQEGPSLRPVLCTTKPLQPKPSTANSNQQSKLLSSHTENIHFTSQEREVISERQSAFKCFAPSLTPTTSRKNGIQRQNMLNRAIAYYKNFQPRRTDVLAKSATRAQFHHILSERRRREMINERFQELRKLLPSKVNKDKVSILTQTREYLASLQDLVAKLSQKNQQLESQLVPANEAAENVCESSSTKLLPQTKEDSLNLNSNKGVIMRLIGNSNSKKVAVLSHHL
ncbi:hypothetical protein RCOM_1154580 [Ricinus communis]|uniref:BHLH domain-containing protein n=1 Tax=Ricinus communis TaxID=3988 RepID=B9SG21_RICCO|nr:hypothetical protein RCOM_1154580 [Ricinus communis]